MRNDLLFDSLALAILQTEAIPIDTLPGRQFNAHILLHERSYAVIYLRARFLKSPTETAGRTVDGSGTYASMPYDIRYPAGEAQWMRLRFEPQDDEKFLRLEIVAEKGACDLSVLEVQCGPVAPRPLSPTWACDSVSGIEPEKHYIEPEQERIPPLTDEIRQAVAARRRLPAKVEVINGRPRMTLDGKPFAPAFYNGCWFNPALSQFGDFLRAGVHTFLMTASAGKNLYGNGFWRAADTYDFSALDESLWRILRLDPQANIILYIGCEPYVEWGSEHPEDVCADQDGNMAVVDFHTIRFGGDAPGPKQRFGPSLYSARLRKECGDALKRLVEHLHETDAGRAVIGMHLCGFSDGQFFDWDFGWKNAHVADYSPAGMAAFREWLRQRYGNNLQALRKAWNDDSVTFETATRPRVSEIWTDRYLVDNQQIADHNRFASEGQADTVLALAKAVREASHGEMLIGTYYEDMSGSIYNHIALNKYLDSPYIDYLAGPADYRVRKAGHSGGVRNIFGSTLLHNKLFVIEQDWRSWTSGPNSPVENFAYGRAESVEEHNAMVRRECGMMLSLGMGTWWYDLAGKWFRDDGIMKGIAEAVRAFKLDLDANAIPQADAALFVSEESNYYNTLRNSEITRCSLTRQRMQLYTSGMPFRFYLMSDIGKVDIPKHKIYIFYDCMAMTQTQRAFVESLKANGNTLVFIGMPGIIDLDSPYLANALEGTAEAISRAAMESLVGMKLKRHFGRQAAYPVKQKHKLLRNTGDRLCLPLVYGTMLIDFPQDGVPVYSIDDENAESLALFPDGKPAMAVRDFGTYRVIYSALPVLSDALLHNIGVTGGAWIAAEPGDAVYANDNFIRNRKWCNDNGLSYCFHSSDTGPLSIRQCYRSSLFSEGATLDMLENSDIPGTDHELLALDGDRHYDSCWEGSRNEIKRWFLPKVTWAGSAAPLKTPDFSKTLYDLRAKYVGCASLLQNKPQTLCEMFAATNWGASYQDLRRIATWQIMQGVNMIVPHAVHHRFRGELKYFAPPEFMHNSLKSGLREFNDELAFYCRAAAQGKYVAEVAVIDPTPEIWGGAEPDNFFRICDKLNRYPGGYVICPREHAKEFPLVIDAMSTKALPPLPETGISFSGGEVAFMRRRLDDGTECVLVANVWNDSELTGILTFQKEQYPLALVPGEIAVIGGPCERYRKPVDRPWKAKDDNAICPVLWQQENLLPFENSIEFIIAQDGIPHLALEVPTEAVRTVFLDGRQLMECTAIMVDDDTYARYDLTNFATPGVHSVMIQGEKVEFHTPCRIVGEFDLQCESEGDFHHHVMDTYQLSMFEPEIKRITLFRRRKVLKLSGGWQTQGHVFYSGTVEYDISHLCTPGITAISVETNDVAELLVDGIVRQKCAFAPYIFTLDNTSLGQRVTLRCSNTMGNRMERYAAPSGILQLRFA